MQIIGQDEVTAQLFVEGDHRAGAKETRRRLREAGLYPKKAAARQVPQTRKFMAAYVSKALADVGDEDLLCLFALVGALVEWKGYDIAHEGAAGQAAPGREDESVALQPD